MITATGAMLFHGMAREIRNFCKILISESSFVRNNFVLPKTPFSWLLSIKKRTRARRNACLKNASGGVWGLLSALVGSVSVRFKNASVEKMP